MNDISADELIRARYLVPDCDEPPVLLRHPKMAVLPRQSRRPEQQIVDLMYNIRNKEGAEGQGRREGQYEERKVRERGGESASEVRIGREQHAGNRHPWNHNHPTTHPSPFNHILAPPA
jgi:hypothetical protein